MFKLCVNFTFPPNPLLASSSQGMVDESEDACDAAAREVFEETGVEVEVVQMVGMREAHNTRKGEPQSPSIILSPIPYPSCRIISEIGRTLGSRTGAEMDILFTGAKTTHTRGTFRKHRAPGRREKSVGAVGRRP